MPVHFARSRANLNPMAFGLSDLLFLVCWWRTNTSALLTPTFQTAGRPQWPTLLCSVETVNAGKTAVGRNQKQPVFNNWNDVAFGTRGRSSWNNYKLKRTKPTTVSAHKTAVNPELDCWVVLISLPLRVSCFSRYWQCLVFTLILYSCSCHKNAHVTWPLIFHFTLFILR